jgi:hypothetical protein
MDCGGIIFLGTTNLSWVGGDGGAFLSGVE